MGNLENRSSQACHSPAWPCHFECCNLLGTGIVAFEAPGSQTGHGYMAVVVFEALGSQTGHHGRLVGSGIPAAGPAVAQSLDKLFVGNPAGPAELYTNPGSA